MPFFSLNYLLFAGDSPVFLIFFLFLALFLSLRSHIDLSLTMPISPRFLHSLRSLTTHFLCVSHFIARASGAFSFALQNFSAISVRFLSSIPLHSALVTNFSSFHSSFLYIRLSTWHWFELWVFYFSHNFLNFHPKSNRFCTISSPRLNSAKLYKKFQKL